jgi:hypothetical protein
LTASGVAEAEARWADWGWPSDIIVVELGLNDAMPVTPTIAEVDWPDRYGALLDSLAASGATVVATTMFYGISPAHPRYAALLRYNDAIHTEAAARGIAVADVWAATRDCASICRSHADQMSPFPPHFRGDDFHPSDVGHARIAQTIRSVLRPASQPLTPPEVVWLLGNERLIVYWEQDPDGWRCFALESPFVDYGCTWVFRGPSRITLPRGGPVGPSSQPQPGDIILMDDLRLVVPPRPNRLFFPWFGN